MRPGLRDLMLLVIDVGNTNTVLGVFERVAHRAGEDVTTETARYERLVANWRVGSHLNRTVDEYGVIFRNLFSMDSLEVSAVHGIVISSVVPPLDPVLRQMCEDTRVIATGGLGSLIGTASHFIKDVDEFLTLEGLRIMWDRNQSFRRDAAPKAAKAAAKPLDAGAKPWPPPKSSKTR